MSERATTDQKPKRPNRIKCMHGDQFYPITVEYFGDGSVLLNVPDGAVGLGREHRTRLAALLLEDL